MAPSTKQLVQSVVESIVAVVPLVIQLFGLIILWGINIFRQKTAIIVLRWRRNESILEKS